MPRALSPSRLSLRAGGQRSGLPRRSDDFQLRWLCLKSTHDRDRPAQPGAAILVVGGCPRLPRLDARISVCRKQHLGNNGRLAPRVHMGGCDRFHRPVCRENPPSEGAAPLAPAVTSVRACEIIAFFPLTAILPRTGPPLRSCRARSHLATIEEEQVDAAGREGLHVGDCSLPLRACESALNGRRIVEMKTR